MLHTVDDRMSSIPVLEFPKISDVENGGSRDLADGEKASTAANKTIALVDNSAFSRECIARALQSIYVQTRILSFESMEEFTRASEGRGAVNFVLFNTHGRRPRDPAIEQSLFELRQNCEGVAVILISDSESGDRVVEALGRGVRGYIPPSASFDIAIEAMHLVEAGGTFIPASSLMAFSDLSRRNGHGVPGAGAMTNGPEFTPRQLGVLHRITQGKANKIIAHEMEISESTVKVHVRNIMQKLKATNRTEVAFRTRGMFLNEE